MADHDYPLTGAAVIDRRTFASSVLAAALLVRHTFFANAQTPTSARRIAILWFGSPLTAADNEEINAPLRKLGWVEGRNLAIERRYGNEPKLLRSLADELVRQRVEIIVTNGTDATTAAKNATGTIPIVMLSVGDPVRTGLVASLARPGGNITGYSIVTPELDSKRLTLLRELLPGVKRVGVLIDPANAWSRTMRPESERLYMSVGIQAIFVEVVSPDRLEDAVAQVARSGGQAMIVGAASLFMSNPEPIMRAALRHGLPTIVEAGQLLEHGGLLSYQVSWAEQCERVATFIDKILRGANPADLPIEQPTRFELRINMKTAKALGINIPQSLLHRADELIQ